MKVEIIEGDNRNLIYEFLGSVQTFFSRTLERNNCLLKDFKNNKSLVNLLRNSWSEVDETINMVKPYFYRADSENKLGIMEMPNILNDMLFACGLTGDQLKYKLSVYYSILGEYSKKPSHDLLKRLFGCMDVVLGSLSKIFPKLEAVCKFKMVFEQMCKAA